MKVAYLILAHARPAMLKELVAAINKPQEMIFVHIDQKAEMRPFEELLSGQCTFIKQRERISWGTFSIVRATLNLIQAALSGGGQFDYYCLLSGCDYPVKSIPAFEACLAAHSGNEYIRCRDMAGLPPKFKKRYTGLFLFENKKLNFGITKIQRLFYKRKPYQNKPLFYGSQWWTLTGECIKYIMGFIATHPDYLRYFKYTHIPDEMFFQTIIAHSPFSDKVQNDNLRCIEFEGKTPHPKVWRMADKETLIQSPAYFARKFDLSIDSGIVEFLKRRNNE
ncbi:MAG: beta-1,6-N-acetylglucosaminyltransferase [Prevotellaceae bacterium]|nr:beta-1,6-N-acetylglucosaminyltransferase [Prevotellaceae bacterium]